MPDIPPVWVLDTIIQTITTPTARSHQMLVGPSGLGDPCDHCLATEMAKTLHQPGHPFGRVRFPPPLPGTGSLPTWIGTAMHEKLERTFTNTRSVMLELKVPVGTIEGYGQISGSLDFFHPGSGLIIDYKGSKKDKIRDYKLNGIPQTYAVQRNLYGLGATNLGFDVRWVANLFIPRDGFQFSDMYYDIDSFNPALAHRALVRAETIWNTYVITGRIGELGSDPECFPCNSFQSFGEPIEVILPNGASRGIEQDPILRPRTP